VAVRAFAVAGEASARGSLEIGLFRMGLFKKGLGSDETPDLRVDLETRRLRFFNVDNSNLRVVQGIFPVATLLLYQRKRA
jgi:hypothetical protein